MVKLEAVAVVELVGLPAAIAFADTAVKSANVRLLGYELAKGGGYVAVKLTGDVGAVKAAVEAGTAAAQHVGKVVGKLVIPRPSQNLDKIMLSDETVGLEKATNAANPAIPAVVKPEPKPEPILEQKLESEQNAAPKPEQKPAPEPKAEPKPDQKLVPEPKAELKPDLKLVPEPKAEPKPDQKLVPEPTPKPKSEAKPEQKPQVELKKKETSTCNICHDPKCPRKKGEPQDKCIHHIKS